MDYANDKALLANTLAQAETMLHSVKRADAGIGLHVNTHKAEYIGFSPRDNIFILNGRSLKEVDKFTYLNTRLAKAWTAIGRLSVIRKSDQTDKMKGSFFPSSGCVDTALWTLYIDANQTYGEKA